MSTVHHAQYYSCDFFPHRPNEGPSQFAEKAKHCGSLISGRADYAEILNDVENGKFNVVYASPDLYFHWSIGEECFLLTRTKIEEETRGQSNNNKWFDHRLKCHRAGTSPSKIIKIVVTKAMREGIENEDFIISQYTEKMQKGYAGLDLKSNRVDFLYVTLMDF